MLLFAITIFSSAFLLFLVQPMIARMILPWFGGAAAVWSTCMMFFQTVLLGGYLYANWSVRRLRPRTQAVVHISLLVLSLVALPILPDPFWKPPAGAEPVFRIVALLAVTVGLPYFMLSTTGPLVQAWYSRSRGGAMPYRLYALSNAGSLLALLAYPAAFEPLLNLRPQALGWSSGYAAFVVLCMLVAWRSAGAGAAADQPPAGEGAQADEAPAPRRREQLLWIGLAACPSALLLAITTHLSQNISPIPLFWVVPLALYLLSLILCFDSDKWYDRRWWLPIFLAGAGLMAWLLHPDRWMMAESKQIAVFLAGMFAVCMTCHGELARRKPAARHLTTFYLMMSLGGALGGVMVGLVAPLVLRTYLELPLGVLAAVVLVTVATAGTLERHKWIDLGWWTVAGTTALALLYLVTVVTARWDKEQRLVARNFYGVLRVEDETVGDPSEPIRFLYHGTIQHGGQLLEADHRRRATTYYGPRSGVALAVRDRIAARQGSLAVGVIGLGAGTVATYGRAGDSYRFYEINPLVLDIARREFTFLSDSPAHVDVALGDARRTLEAEGPQGFDVLVVDAFSGDSIPVHLLTREAFQLYFRHMKPDGIVAVHISNRYLDLEWVVRGEAAALGKTILKVDDDAEDADHDPTLSLSDWMMLSSQRGAFQGPVWQKDAVGASARHPRLWTDEYSNLIEILLWRGK